VVADLEEILRSVDELAVRGKITIVSPDVV